jgi:hypothetical protein
MASPPPAGMDAVSRFARRREVAALDGIVAPGETLLHAADATLAGRPGLLALTDRRTLFVSRRLLRSTVQQWDHGLLEGAEAAKGRDAATLALRFGAASVTLTLGKAAADGFVAALRPYLADREFRIARWVRDPRNVDPPEGDGTYARLHRLERMRARRSITDPEYKVNRRRILEEAGLPIDLRLRERMGSR